MIDGYANNEKRELPHDGELGLAFANRIWSQDKEA